MRNHLLALTRRTIPYSPDLRPVARSVTASILMQQLDYWFSKMPDGFYKFLSPCANEAYKPGDSWEEELAFSVDEFRTAFDNIGIRYTSKTAYKRAVAAGLVFIRPLKDGEIEEKFYASYHDKIKGLTFYFRNHPLVDAALDTLTTASFSVNGKSQSTKASPPNQLPYVNGKFQSTEMGNSIYVNRESPFHLYQENTQKITQEITNSPCSPPGDNTRDEQPVVNGLQESEVETKKEVSLTPCVPTQNETTHIVESSDSKKSQNSGAVATKKKSNKVSGEQLQMFFDAYIAEKPSNFTNHRELSEKHVKVIQKLVAQYKERSLDIFVAALTWCREQQDDWWRNKPLALEELFSNGKVLRYADKHFDALDGDAAYRDRVEGRAVSKDPGRNNGFQIFDEQGKEVTGASARAAAAVANDPLLALFLEQI